MLLARQDEQHSLGALEQYRSERDVGDGAQELGGAKCKIAAVARGQLGVVI